MKKWQIENPENSEIWEISDKLFRVFLFPSFRSWKKNSEISEISEFLTWPIVFIENNPLLYFKFGKLISYWKGLNVLYYVCLLSWKKEQLILGYSIRIYF